MPSAIMTPVQHREDRTYLRNPQSAAIARLFVRAMCSAWDLRCLAETAQLVCSELITNSIEHGSGEMVGVRLECSRGALCVRVRDDDIAHVPAVPDPAAGVLDESGRGLLLTDALSANWGWYIAADGRSKIVYAVIESDQDA